MASTEEIWLAVDCSGSVNGSKAYFDEVLRVLNSTPESTSYFMWDSSVQQKTFEEVTSWAKQRRGYGGTVPSQIASLVRERDFHGVLRFITDGDVGASDVDACDVLLHGSAISEGQTGHVFKKVEAYIVETGRQVNHSALLPFTRFSPFEVKYVHGNGKRATVNSVSSDDLALFEAFVKHQKDLDFEEKAQRLKEVAQARFMGTPGSARVRDAAIQAKNRLTREMSDRLGGSVGETLLRLLEASDDRSEEAIGVAKSLVTHFLAVKGETPALKTLDAIIGLCDGVARKCFSKAEAEQAISTPMQRAEMMPQPHELLPVAPDELEDESWFRCPVTLEESTSNLVLMLAWAGGREGVCFIDTLEDEFKKLLGINPLWLWTREDQVGKFAETCDELLSCQALRRACEVGAPITTSPTTRRPLAAAFPLSTASPEHARARRWALMKAVSGGKRWGSPELWFVNLALVVLRGRAPERLQEALPVLLSSLREQLSSVKTFASLSGLPELPVTEVPTSVAFWLVAAGPLYYPKMCLHLLPLMKEVLWVVQELMGYLLPSDAVVEIERLQIVQSMRNWKQFLWRRPQGVAPSVFDGATRLENVLLALSQKCLRITAEEALLAKGRSPSERAIVEFVPIDGEADEDQRRAALDLLPGNFRKHAQTHGWQDLVLLAGFADPSRKPSDCIPTRVSVEQKKIVAVVEWAYGLAQYPRSEVAICPATCRPFTRVPRPPHAGREQVWQDVAESFFGFPSKLLLSGHEHYGNFVKESGLYPSETELVLYLWRKLVSSGKKSTLPHPTSQFVTEIIESMGPVISELEPSEFSARFTASLPYETRRRLEDASD